MHTKRILWSVVAIALLAAVSLLGFTLWQRNTQLDSSTYGLRVNGEAIAQTDLEEATQNLMQAYREAYVQQASGDFDQLLTGSAGGYYQLQIRYQAAQQLIERALIRQEARRRGIGLRRDEIDQAFQERFQRFLQRSNVTEAELRELFADPAKKRLTQQLLGIRDESVDALKERIRQEAEQNLLRTRLAEAVLGPQLSLASDAGKERWSTWLDELTMQSKIAFSDPLLNAYHLEQLVDRGKTTEERLRYLDEAIAAYQEIKAKQLSSDPNLDYYLAQLYNLRVNWSLQLEQELKAQAQKDQQAQEKLDRVQKQIESNRQKATQFFFNSGVNDERQFQTLLMADPNNPFYYYLYARFLLADRKDVTRALRWLKKALELDPRYVDAYVLLGDLNVFREHFVEAIDAYSTALPLAKDWEASGQPFRTADSRPASVQRKLAEAYLGLARQLEQFPQVGSEEQKASAISQADEWLQDLLRSLKETDPSYGTVLADLGDVEFLKGNYAQAQERYQQSLSYAKEKSVQAKLGQAYLRNQQLPEAQQAFQTVLQQDPTWAPAHLGLAQTYLAQGRQSDALQEYKLAFQQSAMLSYAERRQIALEAIQLAPDDAEIHLMLADFYLEQGVYQGAKDEYQIVLRFQPNSVAALKGFGKASQIRLEYEQALRSFQNALKQNPSPQEQVELYKLILEVARAVAGPGKPVGEEGQNALYQLAALYLNAGELDKGRNTLQELREKYPTYRRDDVASLVRQLTRLVGDTLPGQPVADQGHRIIAPGEGHPPYNSTPPTSGWHYAIPARWGIHESAIPDEVQLRNLAGGGVLIQYKPDLASAELQQLRTFVAELRKDEKYCKVILAPYERLDYAITLTAWNRIEKLRAFDVEELRIFIDAFIGKGPEVGEVTC